MPIYEIPQENNMSVILGKGEILVGKYDGSLKFKMTQEALELSFLIHGVLLKATYNILWPCQERCSIECFHFKGSLRQHCRKAKSPIMKNIMIYKTG